MADMMGYGNGNFNGMNNNFSNIGNGGYSGNFGNMGAQVGNQFAGNNMANNQVRLALPGKFVSSDRDISVQDVPMTGQPGYFPLNDYSAIIVKAWNNQGTIDTVRYVPEAPPVSKETPQAIDLTPIMERLDKLEGMIKRNSRPYKPNKPKQEKSGES